MIIETKTGSATSAKPDPASDNLFARGVIIAHLCNTVRAWGAGFVLAVDELSTTPKYAYQHLCMTQKNIPLGTTQFVEIEPDLWIANMVAQNGISKKDSSCLVDYKALQACLTTVFRRAARLGCDVHIPAGIGSGLAGGDKTVIHDMITNLAGCLSMSQLEQMINFVPKLTLWEFTDTAAASYIGPPATQSDDTNDVVTTVDKALADFQGKQHTDEDDV